MSKELLHKTTNLFLVFSVLVLVISAPIFYYITDYLYIEETDESLLLRKEEFVKDRLPTFKISDIPLWNKYNRNGKIIPLHNSAKDSLFYKIYFDEFENENEPYRQLHSPIFIEGKPYTYIDRINLIEKKDMVESTAFMLLFVIVILLLGVLTIAKISSKRIWKPFYNTLSQIQGFELDKSKIPSFVDSEVDEFDQLNNSLSKLIEKNIIVYQNQKEFVENASHELQTPLTLFQTKIDSLLQLELNKEQSLLVDSLSKDVSRLNRLNKNLLLLSRMDNQSYLEKSTIVLNDYFEKNLDFFTEQAKAKNISIITEFQSVLTINGNPVLIEVLINNLFLNAIRHNEKNGKIIIKIEENQLVFLNTGRQLPLEINKLFNRFSKVNPSSQGNGLGLAIIKKITELNQWEVNYAFEDQLHSFSVKF